MTALMCPHHSVRSDDWNRTHHHPKNWNNGTRSRHQIDAEGCSAGTIKPTDPLFSKLGQVLTPIKATLYTRAMLVTVELPEDALARLRAERCAGESASTWSSPGSRRSFRSMPRPARLA